MGIPQCQKSVSNLGYIATIAASSEAECLAESGGSTRWHAESANYVFKLYVSEGDVDYNFVQNVDVREVSNNKFEPRIVDLNGDGLSDIIYRNGNGWRYRLSNGEEFLDEKQATFGDGTTTISSSDEDAINAYFIDFTQDGRTDLLIPAAGTSHWDIYFSRPLAEHPDTVIFEKRGTQVFHSNDVQQFADVNGDGYLDWLSSDGDWVMSYGGIENQAQDVIISSDNGFGVTTTISYDNINNTDVNYKKESNQRFDSNGNPLPDYLSLKSAMFVVDKVSSLVNTNVTNSVKYQYGGLLAHKNGRGMLGFERLRTIDLQTCVNGNETTCVTTETIYSQNFPYIGMPISTRQTIGINGILISESVNTLNNLETINKAIYSYIESSTETSYSLSNTLASSNAISISNSTFVYDPYANLDSSIVLEQDASAPSTNYRETITSNIYGTSIQYKQLGRLSDTTVTKKVYEGGINKDSSTRSSSFTYNTDLLLHTTTVAPSNAAVELVSTYGYDEFGNKTSISNRGAAGKNGSLIQTRSSTSTYDSRGRYVETSKKNNLPSSFTDIIGSNGGDKGRITQTISTDINGITKTSYIDKFGNTYKTTITGSGANDPTLVSKTYRAYCSNTNVACTNSDAFIRIIEASAGSPEKQVFIDKWGRTLETRVQAFNGSWNVTKQSYNSNGLPYQTYEPGTGSASSFVTTTTYDRLRRVKNEQKPVGNVSRTYDFQTTTTIAETGLIHKETRNYLDQLSEVISADSDGAQQTKLTYSYSVNNELLNAKVYAGNTLSHTQVVNVYNEHGHKTEMTDSDKGTWTYKYNAFGELVEQENSDGQYTTITYDELGRKISRIDDDGFTDWEFDNHNSTVKAYGKLNRIRYYKGKAAASGTPNYQEDYVYASHGKVLSTNILVDGENFIINQGYDEFNRSYYTTYPANNFTIKQTYTSLGYPSQIINATDGHRDFGKAYETISAMNARGQITQKTLANGVTEVMDYESTTGWLNYLNVAKGNSNKHTLEYDYYANGNLKTRTNSFALGSSASNYTDTFKYDGLNRLRTANKSGGITHNETYLYDALGNIKNKAGKIYEYTGYNGASKNQLTEVWHGGTRTHLFEYDNRGNVINDGQRSFNYTAFDKPSLITKGSTSTAFSYGPDRSMYHQRLTVNGDVTDTLYVKGMYERVKLASGVTEHKYHVGNVVVTDRSNDHNETLYLHKDNLGSTVSITNSAGNVVQHFSYDPWGKQTAFYDNASLISYVSPAVSNGYTGHKMINDVGIIHMNGRIYDPTLGRFLQADPHIQAPSNSQSYNRYSYVMNNPMSYTDPSGFFFKKLWEKIKPIIGVVVVAIVSIYCQACGAYFAGSWYGAATAGAIAGGINAGANGGNILTGALRGAFSAAAFYGVGSAFSQANCASCYSGSELTGAATIGKIAAHAVTGGVMSVLQGGKFGHGFAAAGVTQGFAKSINGISSSRFSLGRITAAAVVGGTVSKITGGKFANGAITGAFSRMFNDESHNEQKKMFNARVKAGMQDVFEAGYDLDKGAMGKIMAAKDGFSAGLDSNGNWTLNGGGTSLTVGSDLIKGGFTKSLRMASLS